MSDLRKVDPSREAGGNKVELFTGEHYLDRELLDSFDIVFKTPGHRPAGGAESLPVPVRVPDRALHREVPGPDRGDHRDKGEEHHVLPFVPYPEGDGGGYRACGKYRNPPCSTSRRTLCRGRSSCWSSPAISWSTSRCPPASRFFSTCMRSIWITTEPWQNTSGPSRTSTPGSGRGTSSSAMWTYCPGRR